MYSIELTSTNIHVVDASPSGKGVKVRSFFSVPMPPGAYLNGYIKDYASVAKAIRDVFLSRNIRGGQSYFVMDSTAVKNKEMVVPDENRQNILSILDKEIADIIATEAHIVDYVVYDRFKENRKWYLNCMLYAIPRDIIREFLKLGEECGIRIKELDYHHNAVEKLWALKEPGIKRSVPAEMKKNKNKKAGKKKGKEEFEAENFAEDDIWTMPEVIHVDQKIELWVGLYQDSVKMQTNAIDGNCYSKTVPLTGGFQEFASFDADAKKNQILFYIDQIQAFLQFISTVNKEQPLEDIQIYGDQEDAKEIMDVLRQEVSFPVELLQKPHGISGINEAEYPLYCSAIGAMLRR